MRVRWLEDAINDLQLLHRYIAQENMSAANQIVSRILQYKDNLIDQPAMGRPGRVHNTRELIVPGTPFIIPYRVHNDNVEILRVLHAAMKWPDML